MKLTASDLISLDEYAQRRETFQQQVMQHQLPRQIALGEHVRLHFEDRLTVQYQIQELLWKDKISDAKSVDEILFACNPMIPDGHNWKAWLSLVPSSTGEHKPDQQKQIETERKAWVQINGAEHIYPICDDIPKPLTGEQASVAHILRFELHHDHISLLRQGAPIQMGIDHPEFRARVALTTSQHQALVADLD